MSNNTTSQSTGCGTTFVVLLQITFIILKLTETIAWAWWVVMLPFILYGALAIVVLAIALVVILVAIVAAYFLD